MRCPITDRPEDLKVSKQTSKRMSASGSTPSVDPTESPTVRHATFTPTVVVLVAISSEWHIMPTHIFQGAFKILLSLA